MMPANDQIRTKYLDQTWVISRAVHLKDRMQLPSLFLDLQTRIPEGCIAGPPFCIIQFVTSVTDGLDAQLCLPVREAIEGSWLLPEIEILSLIHRGPVEELGDSYRILFAWAAERGIISDEFCREIYPDLPEMGEIELQFVIHPWEKLLEGQLLRVLGEKKASQIISGEGAPTVSSSLAGRFDWVCSAVNHLEGTACDREQYQVLSRCAHVFPAGQISKLREVYLEGRNKSDEMLDAVDAVIDFMAEDPGWGERPRREGYTIYSSKSPRDPAGYQQAESREERRKAYCFCPIIRENLDGGMPACFCYCGAGWYRQQWEGATGEPVRVEIVRSLLKGDDLCEFAVHLLEGKTAPARE